MNNHYTYSGFTSGHIGTIDPAIQTLPKQSKGIKTMDEQNITITFMLEDQLDNVILYLLCENESSTSIKMICSEVFSCEESETQERIDQLNELSRTLSLNGVVFSVSLDIDQNLFKNLINS